LAISSFALRLAKSSSADTAYAKLNNDAIVKGIFSLFPQNVIYISLVYH
jgi:hypothetical protein